jgi:hypothetical protein
MILLQRVIKYQIKTHFSDDFMFQLTKDEYSSLKCHFGTSNTRGGDKKLEASPDMILQLLK